MHGIKVNVKINLNYFIFYLKKIFIVFIYLLGSEIMVWGLINSKGPRELILVEGRMNSKDYIDILEENLLNKRKLIFGDHIFQ